MSASQPRNFREEAENQLQVPLVAKARPPTSPPPGHASKKAKTLDCLLEDVDAVRTIVEVTATLNPYISEGYHVDTASVDFTCDGSEELHYTPYIPHRCKKSVLM